MTAYMLHGVATYISLLGRHVDGIKEGASIGVSCPVRDSFPRDTRSGKGSGY